MKKPEKKESGLKYMRFRVIIQIFLYFFFLVTHFFLWGIYDGATTPPLLIRPLLGFVTIEGLISLLFLNSILILFLFYNITLYKRYRRDDKVPFNPIEKLLFVSLFCGAIILSWAIYNLFQFDLFDPISLAPSPDPGVLFHVWFLTAIAFSLVGVFNLLKVRDFKASDPREVSTKERRYQLVQLAIIILIIVFALVISTLYLEYDASRIWVYTHIVIYYWMLLGPVIVFIACIGIILLIITRRTGIKTEIKASTL